MPTNCDHLSSTLKTRCHLVLLHVGQKSHEVRGFKLAQSHCKYLLDGTFYHKVFCMCWLKMSCFHFLSFYYFILSAKLHTLFLVSFTTFTYQILNIYCIKSTVAIFLLLPFSLTSILLPLLNTELSDYLGDPYMNNLPFILSAWFQGFVNMRQPCTAIKSSVRDRELLRPWTPSYICFSYNLGQSLASWKVFIYPIISLNSHN